MRKFRRATASDRELLDEMNLAGLRYWGHHENYPEAYAELLGELQHGSSPESDPTFLLVEDDEVVGFFELRDRGDHVELYRLFMMSHLIGQGYGRLLWEAALDKARQMHDRMLIMSYPAASGFYAAMGAVFEKEKTVAPGFALDVFWYDLAGT